LDAHVHLHALVPGGGPSLDGKQWIACPRRRVRGRLKPYLVDNKELSRRFREKFTAGLKRLHRQRQIQFEPPRLPGVKEPSFADWADQLAEQDWCVFIEPPPTEHSDPAHVLKYLARYMTGGPISDQRLISHENGEVTFWARSKNKNTGNKPRPFKLPGVEFVRRWAMHILPKGFTKSRPYGGFSSTHRGQYLTLCRALLRLSDDEPDKAEEQESEEWTPDCPRCQTPLVCIELRGRASWRDLFADHATCPIWYQPFLSVSFHPHRPIRGP
jgi:hypothetical protein